MSVLSINIVIPTAFHKHYCAGRLLRGKSALSVSRRIRPRTKAAQSGNTFPSGTKRRAPRRQRRPRIFGRGRPRRGVCRVAHGDVRSPPRPAAPAVSFRRKGVRKRRRAGSSFERRILLRPIHPAFACGAARTAVRCPQRRCAAASFAIRSLLRKTVRRPKAQRPRSIPASE